MVPGKSLIPILKARGYSFWSAIKFFFADKEKVNVSSFSKEKKDIIIYLIKSDLELKRFHLFLTQHRLFPVPNNYDVSDRVLEMMEFSKVSPDYGLTKKLYHKKIENHVTLSLEKEEEILFQEMAIEILNFLVELKGGYKTNLMRVIS